METERILCSAVRRKEPRKVPDVCYENQDILGVELGFRHMDIYGRFPGEVSLVMDDQGFFTSKGRFVGRKEAMDIARAAGQVKKDDPKDILFSEDLY